MSLSAEDLRLLHRLQKTRAKARRKAMLETPRLKQLLRAVAYNVLKGNVPMSASQYRKLRRFKKSVRLLSCADLTNKRRLALAQRGGFLSALLSPLLGSVVTGLAGRLLR